MKSQINERKEVQIVKEKSYNAEELTMLARKHLAHNYAHPDNVVFRSGRGCKIYNTEGKEYLDFMSCYSALNLGCGHHVIMEAAREQLQTGLTALSRSFLEEELILFVKELAEFCGMRMVLPMNSGAEGVETAMKIARKWGYTKKGIEKNKAEIIFCANNFHGRTLAVISASTIPQYYDLFGPPLPGIKIIPFGDASALQEAINENTVAFIVEPIQAEGGIIVPPEGYLADVRGICTKLKVLFIADEVQTGFGRTGTMFACDHENVRPDLYILGKALGGGFPISAVAGPSHIMNVMEPGDHGSTFGGNPFACRVARAALRVMRDEHVEERSMRLGIYFRKRLCDIAEKTGGIKEVRGRGLLIGVEVRHNGPTAHELCGKLLEEGLLTKETRKYVLRFSPALTISEEELEQGLEKIEKVFTCSG
ncbi:MAG: ornithine--oxo-acid transaminase [Patescibacteria group bacterium]|nr:MAG: ornithine--oxo-acid transaminase [Patescibacteria group bacterium]